MRRVYVAVLSVALLGAACGRLTGTQPVDDTWRGAADLPRSAFVLGNAIWQTASEGIPNRLAIALPAGEGAVAAPLNAGTSPVAELSADGRMLVYSTWTYWITPPGPSSATPPSGTRVAHPAIRLLDLESGKTDLFADGAISPVISASGDVAFVKGDRGDYYANEPFLGTIQIQNLADTQATTIVGAQDNYRLVGWAGKSLLYYVLSEGEVLDLFAVTPGENPRPLADGAGVVAASPDGGSVLVQRLGTTDGDIALLDINSGALLQRAVDLVTPDGTPIGALEMNGDWLGNRVVAATVGFPGVVYLTVDSEGIGVEGIRQFGFDQLPWGLATPRFSEDGTSVTAFAKIPPGASSPSERSFAEVVTCTDAQAECVFAAPNPTDTGSAYPIVRAR